MTTEHSPANDDFFGSWVSTNDAMPPPMNQVYACVAYDLSGTKEYAVLEYIPARHHLMQDDPDDQGDADDDGYNWWPKGWYSSLPECGEQTSYDDMRFPINEAEFSVIAWSYLPTYGNPAKTIPGQYTGHVPCKKCGRSHWMHGACDGVGWAIKYANIHELTLRLVQAKGRFHTQKAYEALSEFISSENAPSS